MATMGKNSLAKAAHQKKGRAAVLGSSVQLPSFILGTIDTRTGSTFTPPPFGQPIMGDGFITETGLMPHFQNGSGITHLTIQQVLTVVTPI